MIGLNETQVGIVPSEWYSVLYLKAFASTRVRDSMKNVIGHRQAEIAMLTSKLFKSEEALKVGLVDEIAQNKEDAIQKAEQFLNNLQNLSNLSRMSLKSQFRHNTLERMLKKREADLDFLVEQLTYPDVQKALEIQMNKIKNKSK